jgi:hypothetical protein
MPVNAARRHIFPRPSGATSKLGVVADHQTSAFPWPPASATGVGSMPGTDPAESLRVVLGELPDLPHLPELPARGAGADLTGRTAALLVDIPVETTPSGWRVTTREGRDLRRARGFLARDLDTLEEIAAGYQGPFKIQVCGPWTLAATIELAASQNRLLGDAGAVRDLTTSLAEGVAAHFADVAKRLPGARLLLQLDEPALPGVLAGTVPTASGWGRLEPVDGPVAQEAIRSVIEAVTRVSLASTPGVPGVVPRAGAPGVPGAVPRAGAPGVPGVVPRAGTPGVPGVVPRAGTPGVPGVVPRAGAPGVPGAVPRAGTAPFCIVHCCAPSVPLRLIGGAGARAASFDLSVVRRADEDAVAEAAEAGLGLFAGVVPIDAERPRVSDTPRRPGSASVPAPVPARDPAPDPAQGLAHGGAAAGPPAPVSAIVGQVARLWRRLGLPAQWCAERVVLTPACGLAGATPGHARAALARCRDAARALREELEG